MKCMRHSLLIITLVFAFSLILLPVSAQSGKSGKEIVVYVTSWTDEMPDVEHITCINYAFAQINETADGLVIDNEARLRQILELKKTKPGLKVLLSVGGWGGGRFSELAASTRNRRLFAWDCRRVVWEYGVDGIDIDWEYPTQSTSGISSSPDDTNNLTKLLQDIRTVIGPKRMLTVATVSSGLYVNLKETVKYADWINLMTYDMGQPPYHNAPLHQSDKVKTIAVDEAVQKVLAAGVPRDKIVMGIPFYGRGIDGFPEDVKNTDAHLVSNYFFNWDDDAMVPYMADRSGKMKYTYDDARSIGLKAAFARDEKLRGAMCWPNSGDDEESTLLRAVCDSIR